MNTPDGRTIHIYNNRGRDDTEHLANAVASRLATSLFNCGDRLHWLDDVGKLTPVSTRLLADLVDRHFTSIRLAARDNSHVVEFHPLVLGQQDLVDVMNSLVKLAAIGPSKPRLNRRALEGVDRIRAVGGETTAQDHEAESVHSGKAMMHRQRIE